MLLNVSWERYEIELALRGERPVPRMAYVNGVMELMSPSKDHERIASVLGRLLEVWAEEQGVELGPYGSWTLKEHGVAGCEPDECYIVGADQTKRRPDLAIEVIWTSGGIDKLDVYRPLGVSEVWFWDNGKLAVHVLEEGAYRAVTTSRLFPTLDLDLLVELVELPSLLEAKRQLRSALRR